MAKKSYEFIHQEANYPDELFVGSDKDTFFLKGDENKFQELTSENSKTFGASFVSMR